MSGRRSRQAFTGFKVYSVKGGIWLHQIQKFDSFSFITGSIDIVIPREVGVSPEVSEKPALADCTILKRN